MKREIYWVIGHQGPVRFPQQMGPGDLDSIPETQETKDNGQNKGNRVALSRMRDKVETGTAWTPSNGEVVSLSMGDVHSTALIHDLCSCARLHLQQHRSRSSGR